VGRKKRTDTSGIVYLITFPNSKKYVGITTTSFKERKQSHISHRNTSGLAVHAALKKFYGSETWEIIGKADSWEDLTELEIKLIEHHKSHISENGYNLTRGGDGAVGFEHSDQQRQRNSDAKTRYFESTENRRKHSESTRRAHRANPGQAADHSKFSKERFTDPKEREKVADGMRSFLSDKDNLELHSIQRGAKPFSVFKVTGEFVGDFFTQHECARELDLYVSHINNCLHGRRKSHKGYRFVSKTEVELDDE